LTITPSDLAVGQVWAFPTGVRCIDELDRTRDLVGFGWRYTGPDGASYREHSTSCTMGEFVGRVNSSCGYLASPFNDIPHPDALADLYAACVAIDAAWKAKSPLAWQPENHHKLLDTLRSAIRKAGGVA
jgi:hypothetical protein